MGKILVLFCVYFFNLFLTMCCFLGPQSRFRPAEGKAALSRGHWQSDGRSDVQSQQRRRWAIADGSVVCRLQVSISRGAMSSTAPY